MARALVAPARRRGLGTGHQRAAQRKTRRPQGSAAGSCLRWSSAGAGEGTCARAPCPLCYFLLFLLPPALSSFDSEVQSSALHSERCLSVASHLPHLGKSAMELSYNVEIIQFLSDLP